MSAHRLFRRNKKRALKSGKSEFDRLVYFAIIIGPLLTLPQIYTIWVKGEKGVSVITWGAYLVASAIWLMYGLKHRDKPIIVTEVVWIILELFIIAGLLRF